MATPSIIGWVTDPFKKKGGKKTLYFPLMNDVSDGFAYPYLTALRIDSRSIADSIGQVVRFLELFPDVLTPGCSLIRPHCLIGRHAMSPEPIYKCRHFLSDRLYMLLMLRGRLLTSGGIADDCTSPLMR